MNRRNFIAFATSSLSLSMLWAGISLDAHMAGQGIDAQKAQSYLVVDVLVQNVVETSEIRDSGYFKWDDSGPYIKTKEMKVLAECKVKTIEKNSWERPLKKGDNITIKFWKRVSGSAPSPGSGVYTHAFQIPPKSGDNLKVLFKEEPSGKKEEFLPWFIYRQDVGGSYAQPTAAPDASRR